MFDEEFEMAWAQGDSERMRMVRAYRTLAGGIYWDALGIPAGFMGWKMCKASTDDNTRLAFERAYAAYLMPDDPQHFVETLRRARRGLTYINSNYTTELRNAWKGWQYAASHKA